jgi:hypothetical protein
MADIYNKDDERCLDLIRRWIRDEITSEQLCVESEKMIIKQKKLFY